MDRGIVLLIAMLAAAATFPCAAGCETLAETISKIPNLSTLHKIIMVVGDDAIFSNSTFNGILLAPVDAAFEKLVSDTNTTLTAFMGDKVRLKKILEDHLIPSPPPELKDSTKLKAESGIPISVTAESSWIVFVYPNTVASVVIPKIAACDAVFYVVDRVFSPMASDSSSGSTDANPPTPESLSEALFGPAPPESQEPEANVTQLTTSGPATAQEPILVPSVESNRPVATTPSPEVLTPISEPEPQPATSGFFPPSQNFTMAFHSPSPDVVSAPAPEPLVEFNTTTTPPVPSTEASTLSGTTPNAFPLLDANSSEPAPTPEPLLPNDKNAVTISREPVPAGELIPAPELVSPSDTSEALEPRESIPISPSLGPSLATPADEQFSSLPGKPNEAAEEGKSGNSTSRSKMEPEQVTEAPVSESTRSPAPLTDSGRYNF